MSIIARKFDLGKGQSLAEIQTFLRAQSLDKTQIILAQAVQVAQGNSAFVLVYEDVSPPYVTGTSPANGATGIPTGVDIVVQFSEAIADPTGKVTITRNGAALTEGVDYTLDPSPWPGAGSQVLTIQGAVDSTNNASYVVTLASSIVDANGNPMSAPHTLSFTTTDQISGLVVRAGKIAPDAADLVNGYVTVTFGAGYAFPNTSYRVQATLAGNLAQPGVTLRVSDSNKTVTSFRIYFDAEDFSTVETRLASMLDDADTAVNTEINTNHVGGTAHNDASGVIALDLTGIATSIVDRLFKSGNSIEWRVESGTLS